MNLTHVLLHLLYDKTIKALVACRCYRAQEYSHKLNASKILNWLYKA